MSQEPTNRQPFDAQALIDSIQAKMRRLADEFAAGEINREQFYKIYEHYQAQINLAAGMLDHASTLPPEGLSSGETITIRKQWTAMAKAAAVYYHANGDLLETIGEFDIPMGTLLEAFAEIAEHARQEGAAVPQTRHIGREWLLFVPGKHSTVVMLFSAEPVNRQVAIVQNMHRDFEIANDAALTSGQTHAAKLVYPFLSFVRRSVGKRG